MEIGLAVFSGKQFLWLYCGLLALAVGASYAIANWLRQDGQRASDATMEEIAILAGGKTRYSEAIAAKLVGNGSLDTNTKTGFIVRRETGGESSAERAILRQVSPVRWKDVNKSLSMDAEAVRENLIRKGWLINNGEAWQLRFFQALPIILVFALGMLRYRAGSALGEPVGILIILLVVTVILTIYRMLKVDRKTRVGKETIRIAEEQASRMRRAPQPHETGDAVALFGTAVLAGTVYSGVHAMRQQPSSESGGGSSGCGTGGGDSGGGGCGGGCGGCGG